MAPADVCVIFINDSVRVSTFHALDPCKERQRRQGRLVIRERKGLEYAEELQAVSVVGEDYLEFFYKQISPIIMYNSEIEIYLS